MNDYRSCERWQSSITVQSPGTQAGTGSRHANSCGDGGYEWRLASVAQNHTTSLVIVVAYGSASLHVAALSVKALARVIIQRENRPLWLLTATASANVRMALRTPHGIARNRRNVKWRSRYHMLQSAEQRYIGDAQPGLSITMFTCGR